MIALPVIAATLVLLALGTVSGILPVVKIIQMYEARHELRQGSTGWLRSMAGWAFIAFWLMAVWYFATIIGDWAVSSDLEGAFERSLLRLRILLEIAIAIAGSD